MLIDAPPGAGVKVKLRIERPEPAGLIEAGSGGSGEAAEGASVSGEAANSKGSEDEERATGEGEGNGHDRQVSLVTMPVESTDQPIDVMAPKVDTRPAGVEGWQFKVSLRNRLCAF